jgi:hypothetical protein
MDVDDNDRLVWRENFGRTAPAPAATAAVTDISIAAKEVTEESVSPVSVAAAARDRALFDWPTTAAAAKAEKVKGESRPVGVSSGLIHDLLLAIQSRSLGLRPAEIDSDTAADGSDDAADADEVFAELGADLV